MKNKIRINQIKVGEVCGLSIPLTKIKIGKGEEKIGILIGIHGDEVSGLLVIEQLIKKLADKTLNKTVVIFPLTNLLAQVLRQRENPLDNKDLNRSFPGNQKGEFSERLANLLLKQLKGFNLVVDLHTFETPCPITAIFMENGSRKVKKKSRQAIEIFQPQVIWKLNLKDQQEVTLSGSLGPILHSLKVPNFAVEMPPHSVINSDEINQVCQGLERLIFDCFIKKEEKIPIIKRQKILVDESGLFTSVKRVFDQVKKGDSLGTLTKLPNFKSRKITSLFSGFVLTIKKEALVNTGDHLGVIAKIVDYW